MKEMVWKSPSQCWLSACVEVQASADGIEVRGTNSSTVLTFTADEWDQFIVAVKNGEFDTKELTRSAATLEEPVA